MSFVSFCKSECTTTTTCKKEKCSRTLTACETTGSTTTTTTTLKCPFVPRETADADALAPSIGDGGLGTSDRAWNMLCLTPTLHAWWGKGYFRLKYLDVSAEKPESTKDEPRTR